LVKVIFTTLYEKKLIKRKEVSFVVLTAWCPPRDAQGHLLTPLMNELQRKDKRKRCLLVCSLMVFLYQLYVQQADVAALTRETQFYKSIPGAELMIEVYDPVGFKAPDRRPAGRTSYILTIK
jgi:hypothetical protein